jgi:hypothetical protein
MNANVMVVGGEEARDITRAVSYSARACGGEVGFGGLNNHLDGGS